MARRSRRQLVLEFGRERRVALAPPRSLELVQALADLLLEALGEEAHEETKASGGRDESQDHA
jgi:hypothetical protein